MDIREHHLDPAQSLEVIAAVIAQTKENIKGYSFLYLLWGWLIAIASFSFFLLQHYTSFKYFFLPFPLLAVTGIVISLWRHSAMRHQSETYIASYLKKLWLVLGISFALVIFINIVETATPFTYTLLIGGIGTLVSGLVLRFKPLVSGGVLFLLFSVISVFTPDNYKPLLQGIAVITGYLVPGYLLKYSRT